MREIGEAIIGNLDDDGYLVASLDEIAAMGPGRSRTSSACSRLVQGFDPIGVAARDLQECLLLQLRHLGLDGTPAERIVTEHLRAAAEPPDSRDLAQARDADRRAEGAHRDHPAPRSEAGQPLQPVAVPVRDPRRLRR